MFVELIEIKIDNILRKEIKWYDELDIMCYEVMMLFVLLEIVQDLQCTLSWLSYAAPFDDETVALIGMESLELGDDENYVMLIDDEREFLKVIFLSHYLRVIHFIPSIEGMLWITLQHTVKQLFLQFNKHMKL